MQAHLPDEWPDAPEITSEAAILVDIDTDTILYAKNATSSMYPASTTKLMTAYLTLSNTSLDDIVTFSKNSIYSLPSGSSHIGMHIGESLSVRDCLYGLLLPSANEVATALAEHVSGSVSSFVELMNSTAVSLGCVNTNFANANGLQDPNHMTCAYDLYRSLFHPHQLIIERPIPFSTAIFLWALQISLLKKIPTITHRLLSVEKLAGPRKLDAASLRMLQKMDAI